MPIPRIETRDAMGDPDVVYLNPDHVLWMSQPTAAQRRPGGTAIRVDDRVKGGSLLMADHPPAAQLLQDLGPFVTVTLANPSSDYPDGLVHVRAQAIVKIATDDHDSRSPSARSAGSTSGRLRVQGQRLRRRGRAMAGVGGGCRPLNGASRLRNGAAARRAAVGRPWFSAAKRMPCLVHRGERLRCRPPGEPCAHPVPHSIRIAPIPE